MDIDFGRPGARLMAQAGAILLVIGALLDTVSNAVSIIPAGVTYAGSIIILLALPVLWALDKSRLLTLRHQSGRIIRPLDRSFAASLIALLIVLWLPRMFGAKPVASSDLLTQSDVLEIQGPKVYEVFYPQPFSSTPNLNFSKMVDKIYFHVDYDVTEQRSDGFKIAVTSSQNPAALEWVAVGTSKKGAALDPGRISPISVPKEFFLKGHVQDEFTRKPIEGASVSAEFSGIQEAETDIHGNFAFQFVTTESEPLVRLKVAAEGYRAAVETIRLKRKSINWNSSLRSYISEDLRRLVGDWEASSRERDIGQNFLLMLTDFSPPELRGKLKVTFLKYPVFGQIPRWGQPNGPVECGSLEDEVILSVTDNAIWMKAGTSRDIGQEEKDIGCGISVSASTQKQAVRVSTLSPSSIRVESPPDPPLSFYRVNAPGS